MPAPDVTAVVITWDASHLLPGCLASLAAQTVRDRIEVLVVDNASTDDTAQVLAQHPDVRVVRNERNLGFAGGLAVALAHSTTPFVVLLNNDARFAPDAVERLLAHAEAPGAERVGGVTAKVLLTAPDAAGRRLVNSTGNVVDATGAGQDRDWLAVDGEERGGPDVFGVNGGACLLRRAAVDDAGGVDADLFLYYEDTDLSWRMRARGWTVRYAPDAVAEHDHASSTGTTSPTFRYYNTRNSLVVVTRHAPWRTVLVSTARQVAGLAAALVRRGPRDALVRARARALGAHLVRLPHTLRERRLTWADAQVTRSQAVAAGTSRAPRT